MCAETDATLLDPNFLGRRDTLTMLFACVTTQTEVEPSTEAYVFVLETAVTVRAFQ